MRFLPNLQFPSVFFIPVSEGQYGFNMMKAVQEVKSPVRKNIFTIT